MAQAKDNMTALPVSATDLINRLEDMGMSYDLHEHRPVFTVEESAAVEKNIPGLHCRNLFLCDKKKNMFLITAANETAINLKALPDILDCKRLSFGSEDRLWTYLGVKAGSVCPFAIINDHAQDVTLVLDKTMLAADIVCVHPMENHLTVGIAPEDLIRFARAHDHDPVFLDPEIVRPENKRS